MWLAEWYLEVCTNRMVARENNTGKRAIVQSNIHREQVTRKVVARDIKTQGNAQPPNRTLPRQHVIRRLVAPRHNIGLCAGAKSNGSPSACDS